MGLYAVSLASPRAFGHTTHASRPVCSETTAVTAKVVKKIKKQTKKFVLSQYFGHCDFLRRPLARFPVARGESSVPATAQLSESMPVKRYCLELRLQFREHVIFP